MTHYRKPAMTPLHLTREERAEWSKWLDEAVAMRQFGEGFRRSTLWRYWLDGLSPWAAVWKLRDKRTIKSRLAIEA